MHKSVHAPATYQQTAMALILLIIINFTFFGWVTNVIFLLKWWIQVNYSNINIIIQNHQGMLQPHIGLSQDH